MVVSRETNYFQVYSLILTTTSDHYQQFSPKLRDIWDVCSLCAASEFSSLALFAVFFVSDLDPMPHVDLHVSFTSEICNTDYTF